MRILVIEDYAPLRESLVGGLRAEGYAVDAAADGDEGWWYLDGGTYDGVVLDRMLPGLDGMAILRRLREGGSAVPVLLLTACDTVEDRVVGLDAGADDYLTKPFAVPELLARLRRLVRRAWGQADPVLTCGPLRLDQTAKTVTCGQTVVPLTAREYQLLELLMRSRGQLVSRDALWEHCYDFARDVSSNVLDVLVARVRRKLTAAGAPGLLTTRRGLGY
ncbi:MAG: response regulator transcription factor, partial [Planctomycetota bacterium]